MRRRKRKKIPIAAMFDRLDADGSGMLDQSEVRALMKLLGLDMVRLAFGPVPVSRCWFVTVRAWSARPFRAF